MNSTKDLYLELMKKSLIDIIYADVQEKPNLQLEPFDEYKRINGLDYPTYAHSMIGIKRLNNIQFCVEDVIANGVPGDLIETGVWRGGATIFMRAVLKAYSDTARRVWVADSFEGLPKPNEDKYPADKGDRHHEVEFLAVSLERVQKNFARYGLLDEQVNFLKGWFKDTLPTVPVNEFAVIRLDGDMYESTMDALTHLYPKLSRGGYLIVDDYGCIPSCQQAVKDYRQVHDIQDKIIEVDWTGVYWQRS